MFSAFLKSSLPDVLEFSLSLWEESQIYINCKEKFEKVNPIVSKSLVKAPTPHLPVSGFLSQSSDFCLTVFECSGVASCVTIAAALGLFRRI